MTNYFIRTKVKRVYGHEGDLSVRCVPGRGVDNEDMGWLLESAAQVLWLCFFLLSSAAAFFDVSHDTAPLKMHERHDARSCSSNSQESVLMSKDFSEDLKVSLNLLFWPPQER
jgi:hypothetical protein